MGLFDLNLLDRATRLQLFEVSQLIWLKGCVGLIRGKEHLVALLNSSEALFVHLASRFQQPYYLFNSADIYCFFPLSKLFLHHS